MHTHIFMFITINIIIIIIIQYYLHACNYYIIIVKMNEYFLV
jgi:hypothetical protein